MNEELREQCRQLVHRYTRPNRPELNGWPDSLDEAARINVIYNTLVMPFLDSKTVAVGN